MSHDKAYNKRLLMSKELVRKKERVYISDWVGRALSITSLTSMLMMPAGTYASLQPDAAPFNPGITLQDAQTSPPVEQTAPIITYNEKTGLTRDTGTDMQSCLDFVVCGTDLGIPFRLPNGASVGYLFGDTFAVKGPFIKDSELPPSGDQYRAQVMLRSDTIPTKGQPITFDGAAGLESANTGTAPEFLGQWHILVNDGISLPDGSVVVSYQHTVEVNNPADNTWHTDYSGLAWSPDGNHFELMGPHWENTQDNNDPYQMWSMQLDGDYVYIVSDQAGRKSGPMMLFRVRWDEMFNADAYTYWNSTDWGNKQDALPIMDGHFGEPSLRKLSDGTWVLGYTDYTGAPKIVTQTLKNPETGPEGEWNKPKVQLTWQQQPFLYGGFIHPDSTADNLILMVSVWQKQNDGSEHGKLVQYDVSHLVGSL